MRTFKKQGLPVPFWPRYLRGLKAFNDYLMTPTYFPTLISQPPSLLPTSPAPDSTP